MKILFCIIVVGHALLHLLGLAKAFGWSELRELTLPISKPWGLVWGAAALLLLGYAGALALQKPWAWALGLVAAVVSQVAIVVFWQDARWGSIPNLLIVLAGVVGGLLYGFDRRTAIREAIIAAEQPKGAAEVLTREAVDSLPPPVQRWLTRSGAIGRPIPEKVSLEQQFELKMKPSQTEWYQGRARQVFHTRAPAFVWSIALNMGPMVRVVGRDEFYQGKGAMLIRLLGLVAVVDEANNPRINEGTLQRFLGEMVWFPGAAVSPYLRWEAVDEYSARATFSYGGVTGSGVFTFNEAGDFIRFSTLRYYGGGADAQRRQWIISADRSEDRQGLRIPTHCTATWRLDEGDWTWARIEVKEVIYSSPSQAL
jgi:hypothetical protein